MQKWTAAALSLAVCMCVVFSSALPCLAWGMPDAASPEEGTVSCSAAVSDAASAEEAIADGVRAVSIEAEDGLSLEPLFKVCEGKTLVIVDCAPEQADYVYAQAVESGADSFVYLRIHDSASKVIKWADSFDSAPGLVGYYKGNIIFSAVNCVRKFSEAASSGIARVLAVNLQTKNPYGVIFHSTFRFGIKNCGLELMFSTARTDISAERPDNRQGWDELVSRGYSFIETAYPGDFAEYAEDNAGERAKLRTSLEKADAAFAHTASYSLNSSTRFSEAEKTAEALLGGKASNTQLYNARCELDSAAAGLELVGDVNQKGEFAVTPGRVVAIVFGAGLVLAGQLYVRKKRAIKKQQSV